MTTVLILLEVSKNLAEILDRLQLNDLITLAGYANFDLTQFDDNLYNTFPHIISKMLTASVEYQKTFVVAAEWFVNLYTDSEFDEHANSLPPHHQPQEQLPPQFLKRSSATIGFSTLRESSSPCSRGEEEKKRTKRF